MSYIDPRFVTAGVEKVEEILHDGKEDGHSVAVVKVGREYVVARRWNGTAEKPNGFPNSYGRPTWDFLSKEEGMVIETFYRAKRFANEQDRLSAIRFGEAVTA